MPATVIAQFLFVLFPLAMAYAAISDLLTLTISNKLALALVVGFVALAPLTGMDWPTFGMHWAACGIVLAIGFALFAMGWIGGGDAKLAASATLWMGWSHVLDFMTLAAAFGGVLTLVILVYRRLVLPGFLVRQPWLLRLHDEKAGVPYGVALAAAGLAMYPDTIWMRMATG